MLSPLCVRSSWQVCIFVLNYLIIFSNNIQALLPGSLPFQQIAHGQREPCPNECNASKGCQLWVFLILHQDWKIAIATEHEDSKECQAAHLVKYQLFGLYTFLYACNWMYIFTTIEKLHNGSWHCKPFKEWFQIMLAALQTLDLHLVFKLKVCTEESFQWVVRITLLSSGFGDLRLILPLSRRTGIHHPWPGLLLGDQHHLHPNLVAATSHLPRDRPFTHSLKTEKSDHQEPLLGGDFPQDLPAKRSNLEVKSQAVYKSCQFHPSTTFSTSSQGPYFMAIRVQSCRQRAV